MSLYHYDARALYLTFTEPVFGNREEDHVISGKCRSIQAGDILFLLIPVKY